MVSLAKLITLSWHRRDRWANSLASRPRLINTCLEGLRSNPYTSSSSCWTVPVSIWNLWGSRQLPMLLQHSSSRKASRSWQVTLGQAPLCSTPLLPQIKTNERSVRLKMRNPCRCRKRITLRCECDTWVDSHTIKSGLHRQSRKSLTRTSWYSTGTTLCCQHHSFWPKIAEKKPQICRRWREKICAC